jgi:uncharacterized membrane protein YgdD (TMEM256/DUF423 family)
MEETKPKFHWRSRIAAFLGFLAIFLGAMGAHLWKARLGETTNGLDQWKTASFYHLTHACLLFLCTAKQWRISWYCWFVGTLLFSGSLYLLAFTHIKSFAHVAPVGGLLLMIGWITLVFRPGK